MAVVHLTPQEHEELEARRPARWRNRIPFWGLLFGGALWAALMEQYLFLISVGLIAAFVALVISQLPAERAKQRRDDPFLVGPYEVELGPDRYLVKARDNELALSTSDIWRVDDERRSYLLVHWSGVATRLPKSVLSDAEMEQVQAYRRNHPGFPDKWLPW